MYTLYFIVICICQLSSNTINIDHISYLQKYGFLSDEISTLKTSVSELIISKAISRFQYTSGLKDTGSINKETLSLMSLPRCGNTDVSEISDLQKRIRRYTLMGTVWKHHNITYKISIYSHKMSHSDVDESVAKSIKFWSDVSRLNFRQVSANQKADVDIKFVRGKHGDGFPFDGKRGILGHAFQPESGKVHLDEAEDWTTGRYGINIVQVMTHEFGHMLGLNNSSKMNSVMFPYYRYIQNFKLSDDDINGIRFLYGSNEFTSTEMKSTTTHILPSTTEITTKRITTSTTKRPLQWNKICSNCTLDAIAYVDQREVYAFKGEHYYIVSNKNPRKPYLIYRTFVGIPSNLDAVFAVKNYIFFIKAGQLYITMNKRQVSISPMPLHSYFPGLPKSINAAFVLGSAIYFVSSGTYYKVVITNGYIGKVYRTVPPFKNTPLEITAIMVLSNYNLMFAFGRKTYYVADIKQKRFVRKHSLYKDLFKC